MRSAVVDELRSLTGVSVVSFIWCHDTVVWVTRREHDR